MKRPCSEGTSGAATEICQMETGRHFLTSVDMKSVACFSLGMLQLRFWGEGNKIRCVSSSPCRLSQNILLPELKRLKAPSSFLCFKTEWTIEAFFTPWWWSSLFYHKEGNRIVFRSRVAYISPTPCLSPFSQLLHLRLLPHGRAGSVLSSKVSLLYLRNEPIHMTFLPPQHYFYCIFYHISYSSHVEGWEYNPPHAGYLAHLHGLSVTLY